LPFFGREFATGIRIDLVGHDRPLRAGLSFLWNWRRHALHGAIL
jgi:hypothetical protein